MTQIANIKARQIFDSRGNPTVEVDVILDDGAVGRAAAPAGASKGKHEAVELRDGDEAYGGLGVSKAIGGIRDEIEPALLGFNAADQVGVDKKLIDLDGTPDKSRLGANAILAVSLASAKAAAASQGRPLYEYIAMMSGNKQLSLPVPMFNIINGGKHAAGSTDIQEFMIVPVGADSFQAGMRWASETFHALGHLLSQEGYTTTVGDEGGYAPAVKDNEEALKLITLAIEAAGYVPGRDIALALDVAASELLHGDEYLLKSEDKKLSSRELADWYEDLVERYPIISIEDGLGEEDWDGWRYLTERLGDRIQLVGDDLLVTSTDLLQKAIDQKAGNAILIKPNQVGTLTETLATIKLAQQNGWRTVISHRSGETEDTTISHLAVGTGAGQIKSGSMSRSERLAKYNELLRIGEQL